MSDYDEPDFNIDEDLELSDNDLISDEEIPSIEESGSESDSDIDEFDIDDDNNDGTTLNNQITINKLTKYEYVNILGTRAQQISRGAKIFVTIEGMKNITPVDIAKKEMAEGKIPLKIKRTIPNGNIEYIKVKKSHL